MDASAASAQLGRSRHGRRAILGPPCLLLAPPGALPAVMGELMFPGTGGVTRRQRGFGRTTEHLIAYMKGERMFPEAYRTVGRVRPLDRGYGQLNAVMLVGRWTPHRLAALAPCSFFFGSLSLLWSSPPAWALPSLCLALDLITLASIVHQRHKMRGTCWMTSTLLPPFRHSVMTDG